MLELVDREPYLVCLYILLVDWIRRRFNNFFQPRIRDLFGWRLSVRSVRVLIQTWTTAFLAGAGGVLGIAPAPGFCRIGARTRLAGAHPCARDRLGFRANARICDNARPGGASRGRAAPCVHGSSAPASSGQVVALFMLRLCSEHWTVTRQMAESGVSRSRVRTFLSQVEKPKRLGRPPFFTPEEETLLVKYARVQAVIGMGLTPLAFRRKCAQNIDTLSAARRAAAAACFGGTTTPGNSIISSFLDRWPELKRYPVSTLELGREEISRPDVVARRFAAFTLLYRDERIVLGRQVWNIDETAIKARDIILHARQTILGVKGLKNPELISPDFGSGAAGCTATFVISATGDVAPPFSVVKGGKEGHAFVTVSHADGGRPGTIALTSTLQDGPVVVRRTPAGFDKSIFDLFAFHLEFAMNLYAQELKILALEGAKVQLSPKGLTRLLAEGLHVIVEQSKMSHVLQALDSPSAFGRFQPGLRGCVLVRSHSCVMAKRALSVMDLVEFVGMAFDTAFTQDSLVSAFKRVGMWPLDPTKVLSEDLTKGVDTPSADVDLATFTRRLLPIFRKELKAATIFIGALSTAGHRTILNSPEIISALQAVETERAAKAAQAAWAKEQRDKRKVERAAEKDQERQAVAARKAVASEKRTARVFEADRKA